MTNILTVLLILVCIHAQLSKILFIILRFIYDNCFWHHIIIKISNLCRYYQLLKIIS
jgi:hypothetical protein